MVRDGEQPVHMKIASKLCAVIGHRWANRHGVEGDAYLQYRRCGAISDIPDPRPYPGM
jgi:hypothetical protein